MTVPTVVTDAYAVKVIVDMSDPVMTEKAEGYVNDAWNNDVNAWAAFGIGGSMLGEPLTHYAGVLPGLNNRAYVYADPNTAGIAIYTGAAKPIDFYVNKSRVGGFDAADDKLDVTAGYKVGANVGLTQNVVIGTTTLHFTGGLLTSIT